MGGDHVSIILGGCADWARFICAAFVGGRFRVRECSGWSTYMKRAMLDLQHISI